MEQKVIQEAIQRLLNAAPPGSKVILYGSYARGNAEASSDLDFLVVEPEVQSRHTEMVRLREAVDSVLAPFLVPVDVLVIARDKFDRWKNVLNTVYYEASREGRVYERVA